MKNLVLFTAIVLFGVSLFGGVVAQDDVECDPTAAPRNCRDACILRDENRCPRMCNATCNERRCPDVNPDCPDLSDSCDEYETDDDGCRTCECDDCPDDDSDQDQECVCYERDDNDCRICIMDEGSCDSDEVDECRTDDECESDELCYSFGILGVGRCRETPGVGTDCVPDDEDDDDDDDDDEELSFSSNIECDDDLYCSPVTRRCIESDGVCPARNRDNPGEDFDCEEDGTFEPLQCRRVGMGDERRYICRCVNPTNGANLEGESVTVEDRDDAPDCDARVFESCTYEVNGRRYTVEHDRRTVVINRCQRCRCNNGMFEECRAVNSNCTTINPSEFRPCEIDGQTYQHGERIEIARFGVCNRVGCYDGRISATQYRCNDDRDPDECELCNDRRRSPVCGTDGRTYRSECFARQCGGLEEDEYRQGRCPDLDVCRLYPCRDDERCVELKRAPCFDDCKPSRLRTCVNLTELICRSRDPSEGVCDTEGRSHDSLCHLPQEASGRVQLLHERRCDDPECAGGRMCGTDGVPYDNECVLRTRSARARSDYPGDCEDSDDDERSLTELCDRVRREMRCRWNSSNCETLVRPREGCCPVCGGGIYIANDRDAVREYAEVDDDFDIDEYLEALKTAGIIPRDIKSRCEVEITPTGDGDIEVTFTAQDPVEDAAYCFEVSMNGAMAINEATATEGQPQELAFATAASPASIFDSGAPKLAFSFLLLFAASLVFLLF